MSLVRFYVPVFNEITFLTQYTGSMLLCYWWVCIYGVLSLASFDLVLFKYSREPFNTICPIGTSSLAFVRVIRIFTIVRAGFIRGEQQSICLTMISSCCLRQSLCFRDMYQALRRRPCLINTSATNLWRDYQLRTFKIVLTCFVLLFLSIQHVALVSDYIRFF